MSTLSRPSALATALLLMATVALASVASGQEHGTDIVVHVPSDVALPGELQVLVNGSRVAAAPSGDGTYRIRTNEERGSVQLEARVVGFRAWSVTTTLNGSGHVDWTLAQSSADGIAKNYPYVTWASAAGTLQAMLDGRPKKPTTFGEGMPPGSHVLGWRDNNGAMACTKTITVDYDEERRYVCDSATGQARTQ